MADINAIIAALDEYLVKESVDVIAPPAANKWLERKGLLPDSTLRPGLPLRKLLREGKLPHAYQVEGKGSSWIIPHSKEKTRTEKAVLPQAINSLKKESVVITESSVAKDKELETLMNEQHFKSAGVIDHLVPEQPGLYCVRINDVSKLPASYRKALQDRQHNVIYIGLASKSLKSRFLEQELRARGHGTLFRSIGAMLGHVPPKGSLTDKANKRNFKFSATIERQIIEWINRHLVVNWIERDGNIEAIESMLIAQHRPLLNIDKNPDALGILQQARANCVRIANSL